MRNIPWWSKRKFSHGQTTERIVVAAGRLGRVLGVSVTALPYWGELTVEIDRTTLSKIVPIKPLGVDMGRVPVRGARFLCSRFDDVSRRERPGRVGLDRTARAGGPADERCRERDHGVSGYPGHDVGADPAAHAVRAWSSRRAH